MSDKQATAQRVADLINDAEQAMDIAMSRASLLVTELPGLQARAGLNAGWAQPVLVSVCSALGDMTAARGSIVDAHRTLSAIQRRMGIAFAETPNNSKVGDGPVIPKTALSEIRSSGMEVV